MNAKSTLLITLFTTSFVVSANSNDLVSRASYDSLLRRVEILEQKQNKRSKKFDGRTGATVLKNKHNGVDWQFAKEYNENEDFSKFRIGGYGEMYASYLDYGKNRFSGATYGNSRDERGVIAIPRFVLAGDYKFNRWFRLGAEIEFEAGGTGVAVEYETGAGVENGEQELEIEKGGEVALEQFHVTATIFKELNIRVGHIIVPVGLTNEHHEPVNFFGTHRPEGETMIIPSTWHENGVELYGEIGKGYYDFSYQAQIVTGLSADQFSKYKYLGSSKQGLYEEDSFTCPAYVVRLNYNGVPGLRIGGSWYYLRDAGKNTVKPQRYATVKIPVRLYSADAEYKNDYVIARCNFLWGNIGNGYALSQTPHFTGTEYREPTSPTGLITGSIPVKKAVSFGGELGLNIGTIINKFVETSKPLKIIPFARYEYYNPQYKGEKTQVSDPKCEVSMWTVGLNWFCLPNLVIKADWTTRHIGTNNMFRNNGGYNSENDLSIGVAYVGWFAKK